MCHFLFKVIIIFTIRVILNLKLILKDRNDVSLLYKDQFKEHISQIMLKNVVLQFSVSFMTTRIMHLDWTHLTEESKVDYVSITHSLMLLPIALIDYCLRFLHDEDLKTAYGTCKFFLA